MTGQASRRSEKKKTPPRKTQRARGCRPLWVRALVAQSPKVRPSWLTCRRTSAALANGTQWSGICRQPMRESWCFKRVSGFLCESAKSLPNADPAAPETESDPYRWTRILSRWLAGFLPTIGPASRVLWNRSLLASAGFDPRLALRKNPRHRICLQYLVRAKPNSYLTYMCRVNPWKSVLVSNKNERSGRRLV